MSDLHIDSNNFSDTDYQVLLQVLKDQEIDHLHLAGDISNDFKGLTQAFLNKVQEVVPVTYNLGNHDMLGLTKEEIDQEDFKVYRIGQANLVAFAGWYDYSFNSETSYEDNLRYKKLYWFDRKLKRGKTDPQLTQTTLDKLANLLKDLEGPIVVAMHFVPHASYQTPFAKVAFLNAFLGSQAFHEIFKASSVQDVVFGHIHWRENSRMIDGITYHVRPLGYSREWDLVRNFFKTRPDLRQDPEDTPAKRYNSIKENPDFIRFRAENLYAEFRSAMTILDL